MNTSDAPLLSSAAPRLGARNGHRIGHRARFIAVPKRAPAPDAMKSHDELTRRRERAFNCAIFQADLHATPSEHGDLLRLKRLVRLGHISLTDATRIVNDLRATHHARAA
jgi:hypothetical protein